MTHASRAFGGYDILALRDGVFETPADSLIHADGAEARDRAIKAWNKPTIKIDVNCFLLRGGDGVTLIDAGCGRAWGSAYGHARAALRDIGIAPGDIARVLLTHIHGDHALGLFDGAAAYFPNAEIIAPKGDLAFFTDARARDALPDARRGAFRIMEQLLRVYGARLRGVSDGDVLPGVEAIALPGHTPGHRGFLIGKDGDHLLIWGDALHLGDFQAADPAIGLSFDLDPALAVRSRRMMLERAAAENWITTGSHVSGYGRIIRGGDGFRIAAA